jgi:hypothetical protein
MRFGKRRGKDASARDAAAYPPPAPESVTAESLAGAEGQRDHSAPPSAGPAVAQEPVVEAEANAPEAEAVVEGEAVELPYEAPIAEAAAAAPQPEPAYQPPPPEPIPAYQPPAPHHFEPEPAPRLADSISHHEPGIRPGSQGAWPEPAFDLAERPEILVGAAFGGGLLLALIIRRLGH